MANWTGDIVDFTLAIIRAPSFSMSITQTENVGLNITRVDYISLDIQTRREFTLNVG